MCPLNAHINQGKAKKERNSVTNNHGIARHGKKITSPHTLTKSCQRIINLEINFVQL
jgi:hypothetical protein